MRVRCRSLRIREEGRRAWVDGWVGGPVGRVVCVDACVNCPYQASVIFVETFLCSASQILSIIPIKQSIRQLFHFD